VEKLTHQELWAAHTAKDWTRLWSAAEPLVTFVVDKLIRDGVAQYVAREELVAEGHLTAGESVREWDPLEGTFSTFIVSRVIGRLRNVCRSEMRRDRWIADGADVENVADDTAEPAESQIDKDRVASLLLLLPFNEAHLLCLYFGIGGRVWSSAEIAVAHDVPSSTVRSRVRTILKKLSEA
jgi:RNA polymerase sigma factor (sigma-70 family)